MLNINKLSINAETYHSNFPLWQIVILYSHFLFLLILLYLLSKWKYLHGYFNGYPYQGLPGFTISACKTFDLKVLGKRGFVMKGRVASQGMALAEAFPIHELAFEIAKRKAADPQTELDRLRSAKNRCADQILMLMDISAQKKDAEVQEILDFQFLLLEDTDFISKIESLIVDDGWNCEYAVKAASDIYRQKLIEMTDNDYLQERAADINDLTKRLLNELLGISNDISEPKDPYIAIAEDLSPSLLSGMDEKKLMGIVLEKGAMTAHTVIIARSWGIPCLIEAKGALDKVKQGEQVLLDGFSGELHPAPDTQQMEEYETFIIQRKAEQMELDKYRNCETCTKDGFSMRVLANITSYRDVKRLIEQGGEGVGLFRTELLYMESADAPPTEEMQFDAYRKAAETLDGRPLIIRTLDAGGDKQIPYLNIPQEENPFLGFRAIRYCLENKDLFYTQLSAILRASAYGNIQFMFPMITNLEELAEARKAVERVMEGLYQRNVPFNRDIRIGMMVETPATAIDAERFAGKTDFFSIGTNDLAQYLFAADRTNEMVSNLNSYFQPALLRTVNHVAQSAHAAGIEVDICGQAGEVPELVPLWIGMGMENLSVSTSAITKVRRIICNCDKSVCEQLLSEILCLDTEREVREKLLQVSVYER